MDEIATKAIIIGVSVFITLVIVTVLILEFTQIQDIYKITAESNVSFESKIDEFNKYRDSNNIFNGLDVNNTIKKYKEDKTVDVCIEMDENNVNCGDTLAINSNEYTKKFIARLDESSAKFKIIFKYVQN